MTISHYSKEMLLSAQRTEQELSRPETCAFILALTFRLEGLELCNHVAQVWLRLMKPLWDRERSQTLISSFQYSRSWARHLCKTHGGKTALLSEAELHRALGKRLAGLLAGQARRMMIDSSHAISTEEFARAIIPCRWFRGSHADKAMMELYDASCGHEQNSSIAFVNPHSDHTRYQIKSRVGPESVDADGILRILPHYFQIKGIMRAQHPTHLVGQIVKEFSHDQANATIEWDTIRENNPDYPFWPRAVDAQDDVFVHRCSLHSAADAIEWSDWPQIGSKAPAISPLQWRFTTGLFERTTLGGRFEFHLVARHEWTVDWQVPTLKSVE